LDEEDIFVYGGISAYNPSKVRYTIATDKSNMRSPNKLENMTQSSGFLGLPGTSKEVK